MARVVTYSVKSHVAEIVLSRPQKLNAMGPAFFRELDEAVERAHADDSCRVVLVRRAIVLVDYSGIPSLSPLHLFSSLFLLFLRVVFSSFSHLCTFRCMPRDAPLPRASIWPRP